MLESTVFSFVNVGVGFFISLLLTYYMLPLFGLHAARRKSVSLLITSIYTVAAVLRNIAVYWGFQHYG